jgi:hypothetical protein
VPARPPLESVRRRTTGGRFQPLTASNIVSARRKDVRPSSKVRRGLSSIAVITGRIRPYGRMRCSDRPPSSAGIDSRGTLNDSVTRGHNAVENQ